MLSSGPIEFGYLANLKFGTLWIEVLCTSKGIVYVVGWYRHTWSSWKNVKGPKMSRVLVRHRRLKTSRTAYV